MAALWLVDRDPVAGLVVYYALAALACGVLWESDATDYPEGNIND